MQKTLPIFVAGKAVGTSEERDGVEDLDLALELGAIAHQDWGNRGTSLADLGRYEEAIASSDKALEIHPNDDSALYNKACAYALSGQPDLALEHLQQAIQLNPEYYRTLAQTDSDFDSLRQDPRFQKLLTPEG